mmetsp:Transcript_121138/g.270511  ORF Transcript_121138/g.270511 Transcript_121138/m.270511 type:complete len:201 (+) Transcript_121138:31-633(+)
MRRSPSAVPNGMQMRCSPNALVPSATRLMSRPCGPMASSIFLRKLFVMLPSCRQTTEGSGSCNGFAGFLWRSLPSALSPLHQCRKESICQGGQSSSESKRAHGRAIPLHLGHFGSFPSASNVSGFRVSSRSSGMGQMSSQQADPHRKKRTAPKISRSRSSPQPDAAKWPSTLSVMANFPDVIISPHVLRSSWTLCGFASL